MRGLLRDPLLHFAVIGLVLFVGYGLVGGSDPSTSDVVHLNAGDVAALRSSWAQQWGRAPTSDEFDGLIEDHVRQEILYREALALGLDRGDTIVRRRLAQKMEFLATDSALIEAAADEDLQAFLDAHPERFAIPGSLSFLQIYFGRDRHGDGAAEAAARALAVLREDSGADPIQLGDRFLLPLQQRGLTDDRVVQVFGRDFATAVQALAIGSWNGPIASGYGMHLVKLDEFERRRAPALDEVRDGVTREWQAAQREEASQEFYRDLRKRYRVSVDSSAD